jgi:hypothetical protein
MALRRDFDLLPADRQFLENNGLPWEAVQDGSPWVLMHQFPTHPGYTHKTVTTAVRIETGYPLAQLDMAYFYPALVRVDGKPIGATSVIQPIAGLGYQRWSRHRTEKNPWKPGDDDLGSHFALIEDWLVREFGQ